MTRNGQKFIRLFLLAGLLVLGVSSFADVGEGDGWQVTGEVPYSYAYARSYLGFQLRREGWSCIQGFTTGAHGEVEHSVWSKGERRLQMMVWRIGVGRTGYSQGEFSAARQVPARQKTRCRWPVRVKRGGV